MQNKAFNITIVVLIGLLIGFIVWQQFEIREIKSALSGEMAGIRSVQEEVAGIRSVLEDVAEIELSLVDNERLQQMTQGLKLMYWANWGDAIIEYDWDEIDEYKQKYEDEKAQLDALQILHDGLVEEKVELLKGDGE